MPDITIQAADGGSFSAYLATPKAPNGCGVIAIQEIFGVNKVMRDICDNLAAQGYLAICPDLFWRQQPSIQLNVYDEAEWARAFELFGGFDQDKAVADIEATLAVLRKTDGFTGKAGAVGYCLGGRMAYLTACRTGIDAAVGYYGVGIDGLLDEAKGIRAPLMLHIAKQDGFVDKAAQAKMHAGLDGNPKVTLHDYAGVDHAFARVGGDHYDAAAAKLANDRTAAFFKSQLLG
jgi:carboxymethylenebutenolidase